MTGGQHGGWYERRVLPRIIDRACSTPPLRPWRASAADGLAGRVVEVGFGSGLNIAHYPAAVTEVLAVEPSDRSLDLARARIDASPTAVRRVGLDGEALPIGDESCDAGLVTFTLCTIPDVDAALAELLRVLRPGGRLHVLEHGISPDEGVARWQRRLDPLQHRVADGCHLTRDPVALLRGAGFEIVTSNSRYGKGPKPWTWMTTAVAQAPT